MKTRANCHRVVGAFLALVALAALGVAYYAQDFLHLNPCPLCLWERWPYRIVIALGILAAITPRFLARILLALGALAMLADAAIAFVHVGVELHWWQSPLPECNGILTQGAALPMLPSKSCDEATYLIQGLPVSMAAMDMIAAAAIAVILVVYLIGSRRRA